MRDTIPEDHEAERAILASLCAPGAELGAEEYFPVLEDQDFLDPKHKAILKAAKTLLINGGTIDILTLRDVLESSGDLGRVGGFQSLMEVLGGEEHPVIPILDILKRKAKLRMLIRTGKAMVQAAASEADEPDSLIAGYLEDLSGGIGNRMKDNVSDYLASVDKAKRGEALLPLDRVQNLVRFGIPTLDHKLSARAGSLGIVAGKTSVGKSVLAIQIQANTPNSLLLSFEMGDEEVSARMLSHATGLPSEGFLRGTHGPVYIEGGFQNAHKITEFKTRDFSGILASTKSCVRKLGIQVVIVDYFQLMDPPKEANASIAYRLGKMSSMFKAMAKDLGIAVVLLSQFNREVGDGERPKLENLKETGGLEQDANWILMAWTEKADYKPEDDRIVYMELAKNRGGARWVKATTQFQPSKTRFTEIEARTEVYGRRLMA